MKTASHLLAAVALACVTSVAAAGGWESPEWRARVEALSTSNLFPGYLLTQADHGLETQVEIGSSARFSDVKVGLTGRAGGIAYSHFSEASYAWFGAGIRTRRRATRLSLDLRGVPKAVKFPAGPVNAEYSRWRGDLGLRQTLRSDLQLKLNGRFDFDDYISPFDGRDATTHTFVGELQWQPGESAVQLWARLELRGRNSAAPDYVYGQTEPGGGARWLAWPWVVSGELRSGTRHYGEAPPSDSNYQRRDQWIELRGVLERQLFTALMLRGSVEFRDRSSSRPERTYQVTTLRFGVEWRGGGN